MKQTATLKQRAPAGLVLDQGQHSLSVLPAYASLSSPGGDLRILPSGNVGVGVTLPAYRLHVGGTAMADTLLLGDSTNGVSRPAPGKVALFGQQSGSLATFASGVLNQVLVWTAGGVGIGTATPRADLEVCSSRGLLVSSTTSHNSVFLSTSTSGLVPKASVALSCSDRNGIVTSSAPYDALIQASGGTPDSTGSAELTIQAGSVGVFGGNTNLGLFVSPVGYVGVGTNAPAANLHVAGSFRCASASVSSPILGSGCAILFSGLPATLDSTLIPSPIAGSKTYYFAFPVLKSVGWSPPSTPQSSIQSVRPVAPYAGVYLLHLRIVHSASLEEFTLFAAKNSPLSGTDFQVGNVVALEHSKPASGAATSGFQAAVYLEAGDTVVFGIVTRNQPAGSAPLDLSGGSITLIARA